MNKEEETTSWFARLKQYLQGEPQNQNDLIDLLRDANERTLITADTLAMLEGAIAFSQLQVRDIMLPKSQMAIIPCEATLNQIIDIVNSTGHSRFPVQGEDPDEIIGILHAKDLLRFIHQEDQFEVNEICRPAVFVPESKKLDSLLREFRTNRNHMALVVDEYGVTAGFVTIEDIIEQIIGDIEDEFDIDEDAWIKHHTDNHYIIKAHMPIEDFNEAMQSDFSDENYDTIGGIVMNQFGYLPQRGEAIDLNGFHFKIINADARRIKLLECTRLTIPTLTETREAS